MIIKIIRSYFPLYTISFLLLMAKKDAVSIGARAF
jgi:hypothetical protein